MFLLMHRFIKLKTQVTEELTQMEEDGLQLSEWIYNLKLFVICCDHLLYTLDYCSQMM